MFSILQKKLSRSTIDYVCNRSLHGLSYVSYMTRFITYFLIWFDYKVDFHVPRQSLLYTIDSLERYLYAFHNSFYHWLSLDYFYLTIVGITCGNFVNLVTRAYYLQWPSRPVYIVTNTALMHSLPAWKVVN